MFYVPSMRILSSCKQQDRILGIVVLCRPREKAMSFDTGNRVANENGWDRSERARRFDFRPAGLMRHFCIILSTLALAVPLTLQAAGTVTDQNGRSYDVEIGYYYTAGGRTTVCRGIWLELNARFRQARVRHVPFPRTSAFGPEPSCLTTRVSRLGGSGKPAAFVVYVAPDPKRGVAPVITGAAGCGRNARGRLCSNG